MNAVSHTLKGSIGISQKGGGVHDGLHLRSSLSADSVQNSTGNKMTALSLAAEAVI